MNNSRVHGILFACVAAAMTGCSYDMGLTTVSGTVTLDGKPVPNATVTFVPQAASAPQGTGAEQEAASPSSGITDAEGYYTLMFSRDREGVLPGTHDVTVTRETDPLPMKYSQPGAITKEVKPEGGEINLELTST